jgi:hypothetical protein
MPPEDDIRRDEAIDRFWDRFARGHPEIIEDLDPVDVATIRHLHAVDDRPGPTEGFRHKLREDLLQAEATLSSRRLRSHPRSDDRAIQTWRRVSQTPLTGRHGAVTQLATAALLLLTLVGSFLAFGPGGSWQRDLPAFLPAISGPPVTPQTVVTETLLDATTYGIPDGQGIVVLKRLTLQPSPEPLVVAPLTGPVFVLVESGELTATVAGTERLLAAGETFSPAEPEQEVVLRATGLEDAVAFLVYLHSGSEPRVPFNFAVHTSEVLVSGSTHGLRGCPCHLVLERLNLPPGRGLPPWEAYRYDWVKVGSGHIGLTLEGERLPARWESGQERTFRQAPSLPIVPTGTRMTLRNAGDDPVVLYRLTLTPHDAGGPAAGPPALNDVRATPAASE